MILATHNPEVFVVGGTTSYREELLASLAPQYSARGFTDAGEAFDAVAASLPAAVVVDEVLPPTGGVAFIDRVRRSTLPTSLRLVFTAKAGRFNGGFTDGFHKKTIFLAKPYRRSTLLGLISQSVNASIESAWADIEPVQQKALTETLETFNSIADAIEAGEPIAYDRVKDSCTPLVDAVRNDRFKDLLRGVRGHDNYTYVHSLRVATLLTVFGKFLGMIGEEFMTLATGGLLHDVGKMFVPHDILNKPGRLTAEEFEVMKGHVDHSVSYLERTPDLPKGVLVIARQHHEKLDGSGYPGGLKGPRVDRLSRMAAIIDIFGAMTDRRVYKEPYPPEQAFDIMTSVKDELDQHLLSMFRDMLLDAVAI